MKSHLQARQGGVELDVAEWLSVSMGAVDLVPKFHTFLELDS